MCGDTAAAGEGAGQAQGRKAGSRESESQLGKNAALCRWQGLHLCDGMSQTYEQLLPLQLVVRFIHSVTV